MSDPADDWDFADDAPGIGCWACDGGWKHGCMDDMCRNSQDADICGDAYPCQHCNPEGES